METSSQSQDLMRTWITAQQQLMTDWMDGVQRLGGTQGAKVWSDSMEAWQRSVMQTVDMQAEWARRWAENVAATEETPEQLREQIRQGQKMLQQWTDAQKELWQNWFAVMKNLSPAMDTGNMVQAGQNMAQSWRDSMQRLLDTQSEWARRWMTGIGDSKAET